MRITPGLAAAILSRHRHGGAADWRTCDVTWDGTVESAARGLVLTAEEAITVATDLERHGRGDVREDQA